MAESWSEYFENIWSGETEYYGDQIFPDSTEKLASLDPQY